MLWNEVRKTYPNKWVVFDGLKQYEEDNKLIVEDLAIVEVFSDLNTAYKYYCNLHKQDKSRKLNIGDTRKESLEFKIERIGLMR
ncbi:hypothetical protein CDLVIII_0972 [Clostridium sp. DL-VIII]|jgi:hypothetical protein|uniref:hypothetical protein n=1 Tax=Clostridium sp. DL-VIII TaxID=641107 RepID=UPI00023AF242|nr:hypothetical protein [Clostridium sp. DL-VIII]EHI97678.1 hypothetical protein CDLVIII_0972 [Clostridium sp. DL-VIII]